MFYHRAKIYQEKKIDVFKIAYFLMLLNKILHNIDFDFSFPWRLFLISDSYISFPPKKKKLKKSLIVRHKLWPHISVRGEKLDLVQHTVLLHAFAMKLKLELAISGHLSRLCYLMIAQNLPHVLEN